MTLGREMVDRRPASSSAVSRRTLARWSVAALVLALLGVGVWRDLAASAPLNPYRSPPLLALGSGQAAGGAHCAAVPE